MKRGGGFLNLPTLAERRRRGDLIEMFKITNIPNYINFVEPGISITRDFIEKRFKLAKQDVGIIF